MLDLQSVYFGQKHKDFGYEDMKLIKKIARLARKHHKLAEYDCNGAGWIRGQAYYAGTIDDYARREYGQSVKSAYIDKDCEETIFTAESDKIQDKIKALIKDNPKYHVEFQGDPRGATVKLYYENDYIEL